MLSGLSQNEDINQFTDRWNQAAASATMKFFWKHGS
jgi:hypothetical protein